MSHNLVIVTYNHLITGFNRVQILIKLVRVVLGDPCLNTSIKIKSVDSLQARSVSCSILLKPITFTKYNNFGMYLSPNIRGEVKPVAT